MSHESVWFGLLMMFVLLVVNGFFVAVEFALVAVRRSRIEELVQEGNALAPMIGRMHSDMDNTIAGAQLGITIASLALGWVAEENLQAVTNDFLHLIKGDLEAPPGLGVGLSFVILSMLHVIVGEQVPKSWALRFPEKLLFILVIPFQIFCIVTKPLIWLMNKLATMLLNALRIPMASEEAHAIQSSEEYGILFEHSRKAGTMAEEQHELLSRSLKMSDYTIDELMIPRNDILWIDTQKSNDEILQQLARSKRSRLLVGSGSVDEMVGFVRVRDVLSSVVQGENLDLFKHMHQPLKVPGSRNAVSTLKAFQETQFGVGVVLDEFGGIRGLFTIHDIIAAAIGENPALRETEEHYKDLSEDEWVMDGTLPIAEFQNITKLDELPHSHKPFHTLAGLILAVVEHIPSEGETIQWKNLQFHIIRMDNYRIAEIKVSRLQKKTESKLI